MATSYFALSPTSPTYGKLSRRCLTPSCVSPPAVTTYSSRPELNRSQTTPGASALLSKVALTTPTPRRGSPLASPCTSPLPEKTSLSEKYTDSPLPKSHDQAQSSKESEKNRSSGIDQFQCWRGCEQPGGYISFPDFERYRQNRDQQDQEDETDQQQRT